MLAIDPGDFKVHQREEAPIYVSNVTARGYLKVCTCTVEGLDALIIASWHPGGFYRGAEFVETPDRTLFEVVAASRLNAVKPGAKLTLEFEPSEAVKKPTGGPT